MKCAVGGRLPPLREAFPGVPDIGDSLAKLNFEAELNGPQIQAVGALEGPVLIIAGAGSGKTRVITYRIAHMLERGIPQSAILALTFTNKAAREMESRVKELTGKKLQSLTVSTFHAFGVKILRDEIENLGESSEEGEGPGPGPPDYRKNFSIYDEADRNELIRECLREHRISTEGADLYALGQLFSHIKIGRLRWENADDSWEPVYREYQKSLRIYNALDFDDLLVLPIELFESRPEALEKYRRRYRYLMVDEFQDTSFIQYRLLRLLASGGGKANVCVVGDDDQSIYSWRGASYENIALFEKDFPGTLEIKLEQNYRSTSTILEAANGVISHNTNRKEKTLWSGNGGGKPIELFHPQNEREEADFIAGRIKKLRLEEHRNYDDFGVLLRTNSQTARVEESFLAENIPYRVSGGTSFFQRKEVKDIISYLRVAANPGDDVNLLRIINTPRRGIGKTSVAALGELARKNHSSLWDSLERLRLAREHGQENLFQDPGTAGNSGDLESFKTLVETLRTELLGWGELSKKVRALIEKIDYWGYLITEYGKNEKLARWKFGNLEYLIGAIENWEKDPDNPDSGLFAWLNRISLITKDDGDDQAGRGKVKLMTIHASKGLEFPVVFIAGAEDGIIPHTKSLEEGGEENPGPLEEERRLFYVAITRARDKLYITSCLRRRRGTQSMDCAPSPFLGEIPPRLIEYHEPEKESPDAAENFFARMEEKVGD
jgi:DNA helicase-2/ATP-dependent DNA helicase PcrA